MEEGKDNKVNRICLKFSVLVIIYGILKVFLIEIF